MKRFLSFFLLLFLITNAFGQSNAPEIIKRYVDYGEERKNLSLKYLKDHYGIIKEEPLIEPRMIVLHYTAGTGNADSIINYFHSPYLSKSRKIIGKKSNLNVASQFLVDRDGTIYQLMDDNQFARHVIGLNYCAIGIENIGSASWPLTPQQVKANTELIKYLKAKYPEIEYLIGHSEYTRFRNSLMWKEKDPNYLTEKHDPGDEFMKAVRENLKDYRFMQYPGPLDERQIITPPPGF